MAIQIINCPACGTFLLEDTAECHACGHVLNAHRAVTTKRRALPSDQAVDEDMDVCAKCGEACRKGLVRCWNCGAFTRPEIEEAYRRRSVIAPVPQERRFDLPVLDATSVTEEDTFTRRALSTPESLIAALPLAREEYDGSDDFELSDDIQMSEADESSFDLAAEIEMHNITDEDFEETPFFSLVSAEVIGSFGSSPIDQLAESLPLLAESLSATPNEMPTIPLLAQSVSDADESPTIPLAGVSSDDAETIPLSKPEPVAQKKEEKEEKAEEKEAEKVPLTPEEELLKIAADEEAEVSKIRKDQRTKDTFIVFCPHGHRIRVRERFRGKTGKCPKCNSVFVVPAKQAPKPKKKTDVEFATVGGDSSQITGRYARWLTDIRLHTVLPEKLKLKVDSLLNDFQLIDVGFSTDEILVVVLVTGGGLFGGAAKKKPAARTAMLEYFSKPDAAPDGFTAPVKRVVGRDAYSQMLLSQPAPAGTESLFGNIPVFGIGRIAVRLPRAAEDKQTQYLSFSLSEFRVFSYAMQAVCGIEGFGSNSEIPFTDHYETFKCHYNESPVLELQQLEYYEKDPVLKLEVNGWKCSACGLIVSEQARAKEKIGGVNGKAIAKAKCPKCKQKFGSNPLYRIPESPAAQTPAEESAETEDSQSPSETPETAQT